MWCIGPGVTPGDEHGAVERAGQRRDERGQRWMKLSTMPLVLCPMENTSVILRYSVRSTDPTTYHDVDRFRAGLNQMARPDARIVLVRSSSELL